MYFQVTILRERNFRRKTNLKFKSQIKFYDSSSWGMFWKEHWISSLVQEFNEIEFSFTSQKIDLVLEFQIQLSMAYVSARQVKIFNFISFSRFWLGWLNIARMGCSCRVASARCDDVKQLSRRSTSYDPVRNSNLCTQ